MREHKPFNTAVLSAVCLLWFLQGRAGAETLRLTSDKWIASDSTKVEYTIRYVRMDDPTNMLRIKLIEGDYPGCHMLRPPTDWSVYKCLSFSIYVEQPGMHIAVRVDSANPGASGKNAITEDFELVKGENRIILPVEKIAAAVDIHTIKRVIVFSTPPPEELVYWFYDFVLTDDPKGAPLNHNWNFDEKKMVENPFNSDNLEKLRRLFPPRDKLLDNVSPNPTMILYHKYSRIRTDVLDFSGHGNIGELRTADRIPTGPGGRYGLRFHGDWKSGEAQGYRIMESDSLALKEGTISLWIWADPAYSKDGVLLVSETNNKRLLTVKGTRQGGAEIKSTLTGGKPLKAKVKKTGWFHLGLVFGPDGAALFINGKKVAEHDAASSLDCSKGIRVGNNEKGKKGFAGTIDSLKIYKVKLDDFTTDLGDRPSERFDPSGLVLHYDFQETAEEPAKLKDVSGHGLDATALSIKATGVKTGKKPPNPKDLGWEFDSFNGDEDFSRCVLPKSETLELPQGTIMFYIALTKMATGGDPRRIFFGIGSPKTADYCIYNFDFYCYHPNQHKSLDPNKVTPFYLIGCGGSGRDKNHIPLPLYNYEWVKLVFSWDERGQNTWINDMRYDGPGNPIELAGNRAFLVIGGSNPNKKENYLWSHCIISDFKILSYRLTTYSRQTVGANEKPFKAKPFTRFKYELRSDEERYYGKRNKW